MSGYNFSEYLSDLQEKKNSLLNLAEKAAEFGWIPMEHTSSEKGVISYEEIKNKLQNDTLTIGVIGQMKCGKSTFLNSFIFEDDVLPAATTPMTASLSVITYGECQKIVAEFYTADEWAEQKQQASRSLDEAIDSLDESKIKAAKELVEKSVKLGAALNGYLGSTKEDDFDNLIEYVGADGKYISITKSVTIYYPKEYLRGVEIVDTPGFNDPIVSREERTKDFLKNADVVLMMLYAGRPFDATDRDIIFKNVRQCGIGKVLVGINKYDIPFCNEVNPEDENQIKDYVKEEIRKACRDCKDNTLVEILGEVEPIPLSAEMALLSSLNMSKILESDALNFAWKRHCGNFGINTQKEMRQWSHIDNLICAVKELVSKEKDKILFAKPLNAILAAGDLVKSENDSELAMINSKIDLLSMPDSELEEKEESLSKAKRRMTKKINSLGDDLDVELNNLVRKGKNELEDIVDSSCERMRSIIHNEWGVFTNFNKIRPRLDAELQNLYTRKLKQATENLAEDGKIKINHKIEDFFYDVEELLVRFLPEFDSKEFVRSIQNKVKMDIESNDLFSFDDGSEEDSLVFYLLYSFFNGATFGLLNLATNYLTHSEEVASVEDKINSISKEFNPKPYLDNAFHSKDAVIKFITKAFISDLIDPLKAQIEDVRSTRGEKEKELKDSEAKRIELEEKKKLIAKQVEEISQIKTSLCE